MSIWLHELFAPDALIRYLAVFLIVLALAMPTIGLVRWVALAGGVVGIVVTAVVAPDRAGLIWWLLMTIVVLARIVLHDPRGLFGPLSAEEANFQRQVVPSLSRREVHQLLHIGNWRDATPGRNFTNEGEVVSELIYVAEGRMDIAVHGKKVGEVGPGELVGEIGVSTGEPATATTTSATKVRYLAFETRRLYPFLDQHVAIQDAVELAVDRNLHDKLQRANEATLHTGEKVPG